MQRLRDILNPSPRCSRRSFLMTLGITATALLNSCGPSDTAKLPNLSSQLGQIKRIRQKLHAKAIDLVDRGQLARPDGYIYSVDAAQLMIYFAQAADSKGYAAMREHAVK